MLVRPGRLGRVGGTRNPGRVLAAVATVLRRGPDGTVTVLTLGTPFTPTLTRQPDGTVAVSG